MGAENQGEDKAKAQEALQEAEKQEAEVQKAADKAADEAEKQEAEVQKAADKAADEAREWGAQEQTAADKAAFGSGAWGPGPNAKKADEAEKQAPEDKGYPKTKYSERWTPKMENEYLARKKKKPQIKQRTKKCLRTHSRRMDLDDYKLFRSGSVNIEWQTNGKEKTKKKERNKQDREKMKQLT